MAHSYETGINEEGGKILEMINEEGVTFARRGQSLEKQSETPRDANNGVAGTNYS